MNKIVTFILFISNGVFFGFSQKTTNVNHIVGSAFVTGDISPNEAKAQALNEAKINALKAAGIGEQIKSNQLLLTSQQKNDYEQFFSSSIQSEIQGAVQSFNIKSERVYCKNEFEIIYEIVLDATVIKYDSKPDLTFDAHIEGIKSVYNNDENLTFSVKATKESYLTIFNITDKEAFMLYPNAYEKQIPVEIKSFPIANIEYTLHTDMKTSETNRLIFVFTKTLYPFIKMDKEQITTHDAIFNWIYSIMPDQRKVEYITLLIQK